MTIFVRVLSENQWFGVWAPVEALQSDTKEAVFILADNNLTADDEYEFFEPDMEVRVEKMMDERGNDFFGGVEALGMDAHPNYSSFIK